MSRFFQIVFLAAALAALCLANAWAGETNDAKFQRAWQRWLEASAKQENYSSGDAELDARIGALLGADGENSLKIFDLKAGVSAPMGCVEGSATLNAETYLAAVKELSGVMENADQYLAALVTQAPGLALAYAKPEWAKAVKYFRRFTHQLMTFRSNQCLALNKLVAKRTMDLQANEKHKCVNMRGGGHGAMDRCGEGKIIEDPYYYLPNTRYNPETGKFEYRPAEQVFKEIFKKRGMGEETANFNARFVTQLFGDVVYVHDEVRSDTGSGEPEPGEGAHHLSRPGVMAGLQTLLSRKTAAWREKAAKLLNSIEADGSASDEAIKEFTTPHTRLTTEQLGIVLNTLGESAAKTLLAALADLNAKLEVLYSLEDYQDIYRQAGAGQSAQSVSDGIGSIEKSMGLAARMTLGSVDDLSARYRAVLREFLEEAQRHEDHSEAAWLAKQ